MAEPEQGDVWWAGLPVPAGRRPVLVLTRTSAIPRLNSVTVVPLTRAIRGLDSEAIVSPAEGLPELSAVSLGNVLTVPGRVLDRGVTGVGSETLVGVFRAVRSVFDFP